MDRWALCLDLNTIFAAMTDNLRCFQLNLAAFRCYHTISLLSYLIDRLQYLLIFILHFRDFFEIVQKLIFAFHRLSEQVTQHFIIVAFINIQIAFDTAICQIDSIHPRLFHISVRKHDRMLHDIPHIGISRHKLADLLQYTFFQRMLCRQHFHPFWHIKFHTADRKFQQDIFHDPIDIFFFQLRAVNRKNRYLIL